MIRNAGRDSRVPTNGREVPTEPPNLLERTRGSMSIEAILIIPAFLVFLALIIAIGRTAAVRADVHAAVVEGARIASLATSSRSGETEARAAILTHLNQENINCSTLDVTVDATALNNPPGQGGQVRARVSCTLSLSDLAVPGLPGTITITDTFATHIDTYTNR